MKHLIAISILGFQFIGTATAQQNLVAAGGEATGAGGTVSFSVGQIDYVEATGAGGKANQGVQQPVVPDFMWTGETSTDWAVTTNWSNRTVPTDANDVLITRYPSNQPHITSTISSPAQTDDLTIRNGATLTVNAGKAMTISGDVSNEGTMLVKASASAIGSLITEGGISGSGSFQMEQYLTGSNNAGTPNGLFYYVGSPVADAQASLFDLASGNKLWAADETTTSYPQITNGATTLHGMEGYTARMGSNGTVNYIGSSYNTGDQTASDLTRTGTTDPDRGYNLLSNPYPSTVSWDDADRTNLSTTLWYRTHQGTIMLYDTYNATSMIGTNNNGNEPVTGDIPPTQAFWVRVPNDGETGQLDFNNDMRSHEGWSSIYKLAAEEGTVRMTLSNASVSDEAIVAFNSDAQDNFDDFDSHKFWAAASVPQLYMTTGTDSLVINGLTSTANNPIIDLGVKLPSAGDYHITATDITLNEDVWLEDRVLNLFQLLNEAPSYAFSSTSGNIPTRFALHFGMSTTDIRHRDGFNAQVFSSGSEVNIILSEATNGTAKVYDMAGKLIAMQNITSDRTTFQVNSATGIYLIKLESDKGTTTHKVLLR